MIDLSVRGELGANFDSEAYAQRSSSQREPCGIHHEGW